MAIVAKSLLRTHPSAQPEIEPTAYEIFRHNNPELIEHIGILADRWTLALSRLAHQNKSSQHHGVRKLLRSSDLHPLFAFEALRRGRRLRRATARSVMELAERFNPFGPVPSEPIAMQVVGSGRPRLVQNFGPIRRMHQIAVDGILRALHPLREQQKLFKGGMPKALWAIEEAYRSGMTHSAEVDFIDFYGSVRLDGLPELLRPLPKSVAEHVVWDTSSRASTRCRTRNVSLATPEVPAGLSLGSATSPITGEIIIARLLAAAQLNDVVTYADNLIVLGRSESEVQARIQRLRDCIASADAGISRLSLRVNSPSPMADGVVFSSHIGLPQTDGFEWSPSQRKLEDFMSSARDYVTLPTINRAIAQVSSWRRYYSGWSDGERLEAELLAALKVRRFFLERSAANCTDAVSAVVDAWSLAGGIRQPEEFFPDFDISGVKETDAKLQLLRRIEIRTDALRQMASRQRSRPF